jgi:release factor glutamine methyltransferase
MTVADVLEAAQRPAQASRRDAETLLAYVLGRERAFLLAHPEAELEAAAQARLEELLARRSAGEPLQYLTGQQEFYGLMLEVTPAVLIPRPETERLVEQVILWATQFHDGRTLRVVDVGTGSGAIAIALATHVAGVHVTAVDVSAEALEAARRNAARHECESRITFVQSDLLHGVHGQYDAVVSNPPYVALRDASELQREVREHEPHLALFAGDDGLDVYRRLIPQAQGALREGGLLAMELGFGQREALTALLSGWQDVRFVDDYAGIPRVVLATRETND